MTQPPPPGQPYPAQPPPPLPVPPPSDGIRSGVVLGIVAGLVMMVAIAGVGIWYIAGGGSETGSMSANESPSAEASESSHVPADWVPVTDGTPAVEVIVDSLTMTAADSGDAATTSCDFPPTDEQGTELIDVGVPDGEKVVEEGSQVLTMTTNQGVISAEVDLEKAPCTAASFTHLAANNYFDGSSCHRVTTEDLYVLQCGDPSGTGMGGPTYHFDNEYVPEDTAMDATTGEFEPNYPTGAVAMANAGPDTNGSQFFIVYKEHYLPPNYTIFGVVTTGLEVVQDIADQGAMGPPDSLD